MRARHAAMTSQDSKVAELNRIGVGAYRSLIAYDH
jgi:hypothetical protein